MPLPSKTTASRAAKRLRDRQRYWRDPERAKKLRRERYWTDPEKTRADNRDSKRKEYWGDPDKARATARKRYAADPQKWLKRNQEWRLNNPEKAKEHDRRSYNNKAEKMSDFSLKKLYGLSRAQWQQKRAAQFNKCDVCGDEFGERRRNIHVDHCHATGRVRSLLCHRCNAMLGYARDNPEILRWGANYLEVWSGQKKVA